jgi:hypothetical protein
MCSLSFIRRRTLFLNLKSGVTEYRAHSYYGEIKFRGKGQTGPSMARRYLFRDFYFFSNQRSLLYPVLGLYAVELEMDDTYDAAFLLEQD